MAELVIPSGYGQCTLTWTLAGKTNPITSTLAISGFDDGPQAMVNQIYNSFTIDDGFCDAANMAVGWTFQGVEMIYNDDGVLMGYAAAGDPVTGSRTSVVGMIVSATALVQKRTARVGRHFRGRMYLPLCILDEAYIDMMGNISTPGFEMIDAAWQTTAEQMLDSAVVVPALLHGAGVDTPPATEITSLPMSHRVATQRRRLRS